MGMHPVVEIQFTDLLTIAMDQLVNNAAKMRYLSGGKLSVPLVVRATHGAGAGAGAHHSQSVEGWFANVPGLKMVMPATPADAKGLLKGSIRDGNPVLFLEHKRLYFTKGPVPEEEMVIPLGQASIKKRGRDVTLVATGAMVHEAMHAAERLHEEGISAEVVDPRTLAPLDTETILDSVCKTRRLVVVEEASKTGGLGGEIAAIVAEEAFSCLAAPIARVAALDTPVPANRGLEESYLPSVQDIVDSVRELAG
jgi:pyruvate dehydrogenase E1 component beta subunit